MLMHIYFLLHINVFLFYFSFQSIDNWKTGFYCVFVTDVVYLSSKLLFVHVVVLTGNYIGDKVHSILEL